MKIITRQEAEKLGLSRYFTGKPCKRGHTAERYFPSSNCVECLAEQNAIRHRGMTAEQLDAKRARARKYADENKDKIAKYHRQYTLENKDKTREKSRRWYEKNKDKISDRRKAYREQNCDRHRRWYKWYYEAHKADILARKLERDRNNPNRRHIALIRATTHAVLASKSAARQAWGEKLCGYTREELIKHIESLMRAGMSWENYGEWNIDHVKPLTAFFADGITDPAVISCLSNLQPLWAIENVQKGDSHSD